MISEIAVASISNGASTFSKVDNCDNCSDNCSIVRLLNCFCVFAGPDLSGTELRELGRGVFLPAPSKVEGCFRGG